jgi:TolB-like protein
LWLFGGGGGGAGQGTDGEIAGEETPGPFPKSVLAVLPFRGYDSDARTEQFAAGVHQDIMTQLSRISDLTVLSRRSVEPYRDTGLPLRTISRELGAGSILDGTVRWDGDRVRVSAELIDAESGTQIWAGSYDRDLSDLLEAQSQIAERVALALEATLTDQEAGGVRRFPSVDAEVFGLYLRARGAGGVWPNLESLQEEERLLRQALSQDPDFAAGWAALARNFARRPRELGLPETWSDSALVAAERALALDPNLAEAHLAVGWVYHERGFLHRALESYTEALRLEPNLVEARHRRGFVLAALGQLDRSLSDLHHALLRDPSNALIRARLGRIYALLGDLESAEEWARREIDLPAQSLSGRFQVEAEMHSWGGHYAAAFRTGIQMVRSSPEDPVLRTFLADLALQAGECETSVMEARRAQELSPEPEALSYYFMNQTILGFGLERCGEPSSGVPLLEAVRDHLLSDFDAGLERPLRALELGAVFDALGDGAAARQWIERAFDGGSRHVSFLQNHPIFQGLRTDPQVQALVLRMQEDIQRMRARVTQGLDPIPG